jgi:hypothetical protein
MLFMDYVFDVLDNGTIILNSELTLEKLHTEDNDEYVLKNVNDRLVLYKKN